MATVTREGPKLAEATGLAELQSWTYVHQVSGDQRITSLLERLQRGTAYRHVKLDPSPSTQVAPLKQSEPFEEAVLQTSTSSWHVFPV